MPAHTPGEKWWAAGQTDTRKNKPKMKAKRKGEGGQRPRGPRPKQATATTTEPQHDAAKNHTHRTPPPQPGEPREKRRGGEKPRPRRRPHNAMLQAAQPGGGGKRTERAEESAHTNTRARKLQGARRAKTATHAPQTPAWNGRSQPKPISNHTHPRPQPGMAGLPRNPTPNARTTIPSQEWWGEAEAWAKTHTPWTPARNGGVTAKRRPKNKHHTTVGNPVSIARALRQPVQCK